MGCSIRNKEETFTKKNKDWLKGEFTILKVTSRPGRPKKLFQELSERSKRKTEELRNSVDVEVLTHATQVKLSASGKRNAAKIEIITSSKRATKYKRAYSVSQQGDKTGSQMTPTQALSLFVEANLSRSQYETIRNANKNYIPAIALYNEPKSNAIRIRS
ncbi:unnamed protein product [Brassicogethes aeneus]|uniref:Uncharacterized protein n=1 Tax=Brassicogethes aeneus TaxID=1431903 RepID=A0A9P0FGB0_BRAAE|nr:unnamed protein product [Brassicogethes aeneus]